MTILTGLEKKINEPKQKKPKMQSTKVVAIVMLVIASIAYFALFTRFVGFLKYFLLGTMGLFSYLFFMGMYFIAGLLLKGKRYVYSKVYLLYLSLALISILAIFHMAFSSGVSLVTYGGYLGTLYSMQNSIGGLFLGLLVWPIQALMKGGAYVFWIIVLIVSALLIYNYLKKLKAVKRIDASGNTKPVNTTKPAIPATTTLKINMTKPELKETKQVAIGLDAEVKKEESQRDIARKKLGLDEIRNKHFEEGNSQLNTFESNYRKNKTEDAIFENAPAKEQTPIIEAGVGDYKASSKLSNTFGYSTILSDTSVKRKNSAYEKNIAFLDATLNRGSPLTTMDDIKKKKQKEDKGFEGLPMNDYINENRIANTSTTLSSDEKLFGETKYNTSAFDKNIDTNKEKLSSINFDFDEDKPATDFDEEMQAEESKEVSSLADMFDNNLAKEENIFDTQSSINKDLPKSFQFQEEKRQEKLNKLAELNKSPIETPMSKKDFASTVEVNNSDNEAQKQVYKPHKYNKPSIDLLTCISTNPEEYGGNTTEKAKQIELTLENFKIPAKVVNITKGPAVTRYELEMPMGISVNKIHNYSNDIAMSIASFAPVRIEAPIPGKNAFGVEVANEKVATVALRDVIDSKEFRSDRCSTGFAVGKEINGNMRICDLEKMPHLLIAGSTGSGKSVCLNSLILSILFRSSPDDVRLILIDPKRVEFSIFNGIPHLLIPKIISDPEKAHNALSWAVNEMEKRFTLFENNAVKNLEEYNNLPEVKNMTMPKLPVIVIIIDELADLMMTGKKDLEAKLARLAQKARAAGMHLVLATQRPSVDVITGTIKNNFPSRIAFFLTSGADSRTIIDGGGAEKLLGKGDMLYKPQGFNQPKRIQGCFVSTEEVKAVVDYVRDNNTSFFDDSADEIINKEADTDPDGEYNPSASTQRADDGMDELLPEALKYFIQSGRASASYLQRIYRVGYNRAARMVEYMEKMKWIAVGDGSPKPRAVYISKQQYCEIFGDTDWSNYD